MAILTRAKSLMELEVAQHLGADKYERSTNRTGERNGYRDRQWDTRVGSIELRVPRVRDGGWPRRLARPRLVGHAAMDWCWRYAAEPPR